MRVGFCLFIFFYTITSSALTVMSYNIQNQLDDKGLVEDLHFLSQGDILALQEVRLVSGKSSAESLFLQKAKVIWPHYCEQRVNPLADGSWESQVILSRYEIAKCGFFNLNRSGKKKRIALWAKIRMSDNRFGLFINTDHETDRLQLLGYPDRQKQLQSLVEQLNQCEVWLGTGCDQWPTIVLGDFNTSEISLRSPLATRDEVNKTIQYLKSADLQHIPAYKGHRTTFPSLWGDYELDHIFVKNIQFDCRWTLQENKGSDHRPIWAEVQGADF